MEGEVEIAGLPRFNKEGCNIDTVRKVDGKYNYRIVNEYEYQFDFEPKTTDTPLSMRELMVLLISVVLSQVLVR